MSDPLDDLYGEFSDQLSDLIMSALKNKLPARCAADALIQATAAVAAGASIDVSGLAADLIDTVVETDIECDGPVYLH